MKQDDAPRTSIQRSGINMFQFLATTRVGCRRSFPRHLLHRLTTLTIGACVALFAELFSTPTLNAQSNDRPNIVLIMADDMGFSDIGCFGSEIETPNIDRLSHGGVRLTHFYNTGRCCPSRASILTGLYPHQADIGHMAGDLEVSGYRDRLSNHAVTLAEVLGAAGYHTIMAGKWHLGWRDEGSPTARGFQHFYGTRGYIDSYYTIVPRTEIYLNDEIVLPVGQQPTNHLKPDEEWYTTDVFTDYALHFIDEVRKQDDHPFFLYLAYNAPHFPLHAKREDIGKYRGRYRDGWQRFREDRYQRLVELGVLKDSWSLSPLAVPDWETLTEKQRDDMDFKMALFAAIVDRLDQNVGRVIEHLQSIGELENTLILFLSDNGGTKETGLFGIKGDENTVENYDQWARKGGWTSSYGEGWASLSNAPFRRYKRENHEGGISAPFIAHWPKRISAAGQLRHQPAHLIDVMPTLIEVSGAAYPTELGGNKIQPNEGRSLLPIFDHDRGEQRILYWEHEGNRAVRDGDWKLVGQRNGPWELYDIARDRTELKNLAESHREKFAELKGKWDAWADKVGVLTPEQFDQARNAVRERKRKR
jgi:arylsulfatase A-like enzyme